MSLYVEQREAMEKLVADLYEKRDSTWEHVEPKNRDVLLEKAVTESIFRLEEMTAAPKKKKRKSKPFILSPSNHNQQSGGGPNGGLNVNAITANFRKLSNNNINNNNNNNNGSTSPPQTSQDENQPSQFTLNNGSNNAACAASSAAAAVAQTNMKGLNLLYQPGLTVHMNREQRAFLFYCYGHLHNVFSSYNNMAEQFLTKSVKCDPFLTKAWNSLGESYWKKGDLEAARCCFTDALKYVKNKETLINLSMIYRQCIDAKKYAKESLKLAKEALSYDFEDGQSWYNLGTGYLYYFFSNSRSSNDLQKALGAYNKSASLAPSNADLYYNRGTVYLYLEKYQEAFGDFLQCKQLDPYHVQVENQIQSIIMQMRKIATSVGQGNDCTEAQGARLLDGKGRFVGRFIQEIFEGSNQYCRIFLLYHKGMNTFVVTTVYHVIPYSEQMMIKAGLTGTGIGTGNGFGTVQGQGSSNNGNGNSNNNSSNWIFKENSGIIIEEAQIKQIKFSKSSMITNEKKDKTNRSSGSSNSNSNCSNSNSNCSNSNSSNSNSNSNSTITNNFMTYWSIRVENPQSLLFLPTSIGGDEGAAVRLPDHYVQSSEISIQARPE